MAEIRIKTSSLCELVDITHEINAEIPPSLTCGICHLFCPHTTAGLTVNENADPDVKHDLLAKLDRLIPSTETYYRHAEGNSAAHLKASLMGFSHVLPVRSGRLVLGTWQGVYLCEFDGPRTRTVRLYFQKAEEK
ncbi:MAG: hypothetical protein BWY31_02962 [Lentisphaerae bacterium ADurb.Bin242]|nr:MAG: hypothetical protein BWY31_02962 [Lentisphaerae bacterium ADurb.Bin242]